MRRLAHAVSLVALVCALVACGDDDVTPPPDAGPSDTGMPVDSPPAVCANATECDDGLFCNGPETCSPGATGADAMGCVPGTDPCTGGACSETANTCSSCGTSDVDGDGVDAVACGGTDCDDDDALRFPGATEICDGDDEDCNDTTFGARDTDVDGAIDAMCCNGTVCGPDCDDTNASVGPTGTETCNGLDDNCDGTADEGVQVTVFVDADRDGHGNAAMSAMACAGVAGYSAYGDDCDDTTPLRSPSLPELCDTLDNDCDAATAAVGTATVPWYRDSDGDGFGDPAVTVTACSPPAMHVLLGTDCDDADSMVHPAAAEQCNARDDNCDGFANYIVSPGDFEDDDADGFFDGRCLGGNDCNDRNPTIHPGGTEVCNGLDDNCDMTADESGGTWSFYTDTDGDGFGTGTAMPSASCTIPAGQSPYAGDCDDFDDTRSPGTPEICNSIDDDCDTDVDEDPAARGSCARIGSLMTCTAGECVILACAGTSRDCNAMAADGCEADVFADPRNCGACGNACPGAGALCTAGACAMPTIIDMGVGANALCVTTDTGTVSCSGTLPNADGMMVHYASGFETVAGIDDAVAMAVGSDPSPGGPPSGRLDFHLCALRTGGRVSCWGLNDRGQLGDGTMTDRGTPTEITSITDATQLVVGADFSCALRSTGGVLCWGANDRGQLGNGTTTSSMTPRSVMGLTGVTSLSAGPGYVCAVRTAGAVVCWGDNSAGEFVTAGMSQYTSPTAVADFAMSAEVLGIDGFPCRRSIAGAVTCRAGASFGAPPPAVSGWVTPVQLAGTAEYLCERETDGTVRCTATGRDSDGFWESRVLASIAGLDGVAQIGAAGTRACARLTDGEIWCWNEYDDHPARVPGFPVCSSSGEAGRIADPLSCDSLTGVCISACLAGAAPYLACVDGCIASDSTAVDCDSCVNGGIGTAGCGGAWRSLDCCTRQFCPTGDPACVAMNCPREVSIIDTCLDAAPTALTGCYRGAVACGVAGGACCSGTTCSTTNTVCTAGRCVWRACAQPLAPLPPTTPHCSAATQSCISTCGLTPACLASCSAADTTPANGTTGLNCAGCLDFSPRQCGDANGCHAEVAALDCCRADSCGGSTTCAACSAQYTAALTCVTGLGFTCNSAVLYCLGGGLP